MEMIDKAFNVNIELVGHRQFTYVHGQRRKQMSLLDFGTNRKLIYDFLLVINTNLSPVLHRFRDRPIAFDRSKSLYLATSLAFNSHHGGVPLGRPP